MGLAEESPQTPALVDYRVTGGKVGFTPSREMAQNGETAQLAPPVFGGSARVDRIAPCLVAGKPQWPNP